MAYVLHTDIETFFEGLQDRVVRVQGQVLRESVENGFAQRLTSVITLTAQETATGLIRATRVVVEVVNGRGILPEPVNNAVYARAQEALAMIDDYALSVIGVREIGDGILSVPGLLDDLNQITATQHLWEVHGDKSWQRELVRVRRAPLKGVGSDEFEGETITSIEAHEM